jgi:hypothetical protein
LITFNELDSQGKQCKDFEEKVAVSEKAEEPGCLVAELVEIINTQKWQLLGVTDIADE